MVAQKPLSAGATTVMVATAAAAAATVSTVTVAASATEKPQQQQQQQHHHMATGSNSSGSSNISISSCSSSGEGGMKSAAAASSAEPAGGPWRADLQVLLVLAAHWLLSSTITFSNNYLVDHKLPNLTVLLSALQTVTASLLLAPLVWWRQRDVLRQLPYRELLIGRSGRATFLPLCCCFIGMLTFNRMSLRQVGVACLQISRSLTVVFTLAFTYWLLNSPVRRTSLVCCATVIAGFSLGVNQSLESVTFKGFIFGTISSLFASMETTLTKKALPSFDSSPLLLTCLMNAACALLFLPLLLLTGQLAVLHQHWSQLLTPSFLLTLALSNLGTAAFGVLTYRVIHVTSPLTLVISNSAHTTAQTLLAVAFFRQSTTPLWWLSVALILLGTTGYAATRAKDMHHQLQQPHLQPLQHGGGGSKLQSA